MVRLEPVRRFHGLVTLFIVLGMIMGTVILTSPSGLAQSSDPSPTPSDGPSPEPSPSPSPVPSPSEDPAPTEEDPEVLIYGDDTITWWGDSCETITVVLTMDVDAGEEPDEVVWDSGVNCEPIIIDPPTVDSSASSAARQVRAAKGGFRTLAPACLPTKFSWIHTSHTIQDLPNIDLAWLRTSFKRGWRCDTTYWTEVSGDMIAFDGSGPSWWSHQAPFWAVINWTCLPIVNLCSQAKSEARAWFRVDFGGCHQDIRINNAVWTRADGTHTFQTSKSASCTGLHSSTGSMVNGSKTDGYGGAQTTVTAVPNQSGT